MAKKSPLKTDCQEGLLNLNPKNIKPMQSEILDDHLHEPLITYEVKEFPEMYTIPRYILIGSLFVFGTGNGLLLAFLVVALGQV